MKKNGSNHLHKRQGSNKSNIEPKKPDNSAGVLPKNPTNWENLGTGIKKEKK